MRLVIFGLSNMLGDFIDCGLALGCTDFSIVRNMPEATRERTRSAEDRLAQLQQLRPDVRAGIVELAAFTPLDGDRYALGTTAAGRGALLDEAEARFGSGFDPLIHPRAYVSPLARLGPASFVGAGSVIGPFSALGRAVFVNRGVTIGHDTRIGDYSRVQPGSHIGGHVTIGARVTIGIGAAIIEERLIGDDAFIAGGALVIGDVPPGWHAAGAPARARAPGNAPGQADRVAPAGSSPA